MFKRVRWMGMGAVIGIGVSTWARHKVERTLDEHPSVQVGATILGATGRLSQRLAAALADGKAAMAEREALRAELELSGRPPARPGPPRLRVVEPTALSFDGEDGEPAPPTIRPRPGGRHHRATHPSALGPPPLGPLPTAPRRRR